MLRLWIPNFQQHQQQMQSNNMNTAYQSKPQMNTRMQQSSVNPYVNSDKSRQSPAIPSQYVNNQQNNKVQKQQMPQQGNKPNKQQQQQHQGMNNNNKAPPVPTLVRGSGSSLVGKKPTHLPDEVVKSNQANERASLLQSLSSLLTDKPIIPDPISGDGGTDWSTKVANSSPLPQRKPGMRHPGVEKFKDGANRPGRSGGGDSGGRNRRGRGGRKTLPNPISTHNAIDMMDNKQQQQQTMGMQAAAAASAAALAASKAAAKKLTLADTKPKKGEVSKINIRETSAVGGVVAPTGGGGITMVKPPSAASDVVGNDV